MHECSTFAGSSQQQLHKAVLAGMRHKVWELICGQQPFIQISSGRIKALLQAMQSEARQTGSAWKGMQAAGGRAASKEGKKRMGSNTGCLAPLCGLFINTTALKVPGRSLSRVLVEPNQV